VPDRKKTKWLIPRSVLKKAADQTQRDLKRSTTSWGEKEKAHCRELCGQEYDHIETDWIGHHAENLRKLPEGSEFKLETTGQGHQRKKYREPHGRYKEYLASAHWQIFRVNVIQWWGGRCCLCNKPGFEVHHRTYERVHNEELCDCVYLCKPCHKKHHGVMVDGNEFFNDSEPAGDVNGDGTSLFTT